MLASFENYRKREIQIIVTFSEIIRFSLFFIRLKPSKKYVLDKENSELVPAILKFCV